MIEFFGKNENIIVGGKIDRFEEGKGASGEKLTTVILKGTEWNPELFKNEEKEIRVDCWNSENNNLANNVKKLAKNTFVTFLCKKKGEGTYSAYRMKTRGIWSFPADESGSERNILVGIITQITESKIPGQYTQLTMPVNTYKKTDSGYETITKWSDIRFWDNSISGGRNDAKNAKMLAPTAEGKKLAVLICSGNIADKTRRNPLYNGKKFEVIR